MVFEAIELRQVKNGIIVVLRTDDDESEYVFDKSSKALKFVKELLEANIELKKMFTTRKLEIEKELG